MKFYKSKFTIILFLFFISSMSTHTFAYELDDYLNEIRKSTATGGTGGGAFDMINTMPWDPYVKIKSLAIGVGTYKNMTAITGFKTTWTNGSSSSAGGFGGTSTTIQFGDDEYIDKISIGRRQNGYTHNYYVTYIEVWTTEGNNYEYGGEWSSAVTQDFTEGTVTQPIAFCGSSGTIIDSLGYYYMQRINLVPQYVNIDTDAESILTSEDGALITKAMVNTENKINTSSVTEEIRKINSFTRSWSDTTSVSGTVGLTLEKTVSFWGLAKVKASLKAEITTMGSWTVGESTTDTTWKTLSATENLIMDPYGIHVVVANLFVDEADVPFEYVYKNSFDGREFILTGSFSDVFNGVSAGYFIKIGYWDPDTYECNIYPEWEGQFTISCPVPNPGTYSMTEGAVESDVESGIKICNLEVIDPENLPDNLIVVDGDLIIGESGGGKPKK